MSGTIHQINVSGGGVPKKPQASCRVTKGGLAGDRQAKPGIHGGPYRAVSLFPLEGIEELAAQGHPIVPGGVGENVTTVGLDWSALAPGARIRLGAEVEIEVTSYAAPCQTIAGSFSDGNMNRLNHKKHPDRSRLYALVLREGTIRPGDPIEVLAFAKVENAPIAAEQAVRACSQVGFPVSDLERAVAFYRDVLGARYIAEVSPGLAMLSVGDINLLLDGPGHSGEAVRHSAATLYFRVDDIAASFEAMRARGARFEAAPILQWESDDVQGWMAFFEDPDSNPLALTSVVPKP